MIFIKNSILPDTSKNQQHVVGNLRGVVSCCWNGDSEPGRIIKKMLDEKEKQDQEKREKKSFFNNYLGSLHQVPHLG